MAKGSQKKEQSSESEMQEIEGLSDSESENDISDDSINSDEIPDGSSDGEQPTGKTDQKVDVDDDDEEEEESQQESVSDSSEQADVDNVEAEYSSDSDDDAEKTVNNSNYFERVLAAKGENDILKEIEYDSQVLLGKKLSKIDIEKSEIYEQDQGEFVKLLGELEKGGAEEESKLKALSKLSRSRAMNLQNGIGLLSAKNEIMSSYLICLQFYALYKLQGITLKGSTLLRRLIYFRTLLAKLKPVETKMDYQISKLLKLSLKQPHQNNSSKSDSQQDPSSFRPRPDLIAKDQDNEHEDEDNEEESLDEDIEGLSDDEIPKKNIKNAEQKKPAKYVPPMLTAVFKDEDKVKLRAKQEEARRKQYLVRQLSKNLSSDINVFKDDRPVVNRFSETDKLAKKEKELRDYEEQNFVRLPTTKQDKKRLKQIEKGKQKLERIDNMQELKDIRELLHYEKLAVDPEVEKRNKEKLKETLKKYNRNNEKGNNNKNYKGSKPTKKQQRS